jgi:hypothetical protein
VTGLVVHGFDPEEHPTAIASSHEYDCLSDTQRYPQPMTRHHFLTLCIGLPAGAFALIQPCLGEPAVAPETPVTRQLRDIIIPMIAFESITLEEACDFFQFRSGELASDKKGLKIEIEAMEKSPPKIDSMRLRAVPIGVVLAYVAEKTHTRLVVAADRVRFVAVKPGDAGGGKATDFANVKAAPVSDPKTIVIPSVIFEAITLGEAVDFVRLRSCELDPAGQRGINIVSFVDAAKAKRITKLKMKDVTAKALLEAIAEATGTKVVFGTHAVEFRSSPAK